MTSRFIFFAAFMVFIIFIILLFAGLFTKIFSFIANIVTELSLRV